MCLRSVSIGARTVAGEVDKFEQYSLTSVSGDFADTRHELKPKTYGEEGEH